MSDEIDKIEQARTQFVRVTNNLPFEIWDFYDGRPYRIPPGQHENLPIEAAAHILGYSEPMNEEAMERHICRRMGWNTKDFLELNPKTKKSKAREHFEALKIEPVVYKLVRVEDEKVDPNAPIPADPEIPEAHSGRGRRRWDRDLEANA